MLKLIEIPPFCTSCSTRVKVSLNSHENQRRLTCGTEMSLARLHTDANILRSLLTNSVNCNETVCVCACVWPFPHRNIQHTVLHLAKRKPYCIHPFKGFFGRGGGVVFGSQRSADGTPASSTTIHSWPHFFPHPTPY